MSRLIYIYSLSDPKTNEIRYIGKTTNVKSRLANHIYKSKNKKTHRDCWIHSLLSDGLKPALNVIDVCNEDQWEEREKYYISIYPNLVNHSYGGEGNTRDSMNDIKSIGGVKESIKMAIELLLSKTKTDREIEIELGFSKGFLSRARNGYIKWINDNNIKIPYASPLGKQRHGGGWNKGKKMR